jgi:hypothetical protein
LVNVAATGASRKTLPCDNSRDEGDATMAVLALGYIGIDAPLQVTRGQYQEVE